MNMKCSERHCWGFRHLLRLLEGWQSDPDVWDNTGLRRGENRSSAVKNRLYRLVLLHEECARRSPELRFMVQKRSELAVFRLGFLIHVKKTAAVTQAGLIPRQ